MRNNFSNSKNNNIMINWNKSIKWKYEKSWIINNYQKISVCI